MLLPLVLLFIAVPIAELAAIIQVGQLIGVWWTIALLIADSLLGAWLMRHQGRAAAVTFSFADAAAGLCGLARLTITDAGHGHALAVLFAGGEPVATLAGDEIPLDAGADFARLALPGLAGTVEDPLHRWTVRFDEGERGFGLTFHAAGPP